MSFNIEQNGKKRVVIVGGGFGGLKLANKLRGSGLQVVLIDKNNYHQFPPLIYQIASAGIEPSAIAFPFRKMFKHRRDFYYRMAEARAVFPEQKILQTSIGKVKYDYLVFAAGTTTNFYGNKHIEEEAIPMKTLSEAMGLRNALLGNLERSVTCATEQERRELLNIVIVGGGATGIEIAGAIAEMRRYVLPKDYPELHGENLNIHLLEASDRLLSGMSQQSSSKVKEFLEGMGVNVMLGCRVTDYADHRVILADGTSIPTRSFIWVSGVRANTVGNLPEASIGRGGRIKVDAFNRVEGLDDVFCIGDQCIMAGDAAYPGGHPQLAQVAIQQGNLLAANLRRLVRGETMRPFTYRNLGSMATVGRNRAVAEFASFKTQGWLAWLLWLVVHLRSILGVRNKIAVLFNWLWDYISYGHSIRLIVYARKAKEVSDREARESRVHWGEDLMPQAGGGKQD